LITQRGNGFDADAFVSVWTCQLYVSDWLESAPPPLLLTVTPTGKDWHVKVNILMMKISINSSLQRAFLFTGEWFLSGRRHFSQSG